MLVGLQGWSSDELIGEFRDVMDHLQISFLTPRQDKEDENQVIIATAV